MFFNLGKTSKPIKNILSYLTPSDFYALKTTSSRNAVDCTHNLFWGDVLANPDITLSFAILNKNYDLVRWIVKTQKIDISQLSSWFWWKEGQIGPDRSSPEYVNALIQSPWWKSILYNNHNNPTRHIPFAEPSLIERSFKHLKDFKLVMRVWNYVSNWKHIPFIEHDLHYNDKYIPHTFIYNNTISKDLALHALRCNNAVLNPWHIQVNGIKYTKSNAQYNKNTAIFIYHIHKWSQKKGSLIYSIDYWNQRKQWNAIALIFKIYPRICAGHFLNTRGDPNISKLANLQSIIQNMDSESKYIISLMIKQYHDWLWKYKTNKNNPNIADVFSYIWKMQIFDFKAKDYIKLAIDSENLVLVDILYSQLGYIITPIDVEYARLHSSFAMYTHLKSFLINVIANPIMILVIVYIYIIAMLTISRLQYINSQKIKKKIESS